MKFLIWFLCLFVFTFLNEILGAAIGIKLGYLILYLVCAATAGALCKKWDANNKNKEEDKKEQQEPIAEAPVISDTPPAPVLQPDPVPQHNVSQESIVVTEAEKQELKNRARMYLPRNLEQTGAQKQIIQMLAACVPSVRPCLNDAEIEIWPKVEQNLLPMNNALAQCGHKIEKLIGITIIENLKLETQSEENLLKAWVALDFYSFVLRPDYSVNIRKLQDHIAAVLKNK